MSAVQEPTGNVDRERAALEAAVRPCATTLENTGDNSVDATGWSVWVGLFVSRGQSKGGGKAVGRSAKGRATTPKSLPHMAGACAVDDCVDHGSVQTFPSTSMIHFCRRHAVIGSRIAKYQKFTKFAKKLEEQAAAAGCSQQASPWATHEAVVHFNQRYVRLYHRISIYTDDTLPTTPAPPQPALPPWFANIECNSTIPLMAVSTTLYQNDMSTLHTESTRATSLASYRMTACAGYAMILDTATKETHAPKDYVAQQCNLDPFDPSSVTPPVIDPGTPAGINSTSSISAQCALLGCSVMIAAASTCAAQHYNPSLGSTCQFSSQQVGISPIAPSGTATTPAQVPPPPLPGLVPVQLRLKKTGIKLANGRQPRLASSAAEISGNSTGGSRDDDVAILVRVHRDTSWKPAFLSGTVPCNATYLPTYHELVGCRLLSRGTISAPFLGHHHWDCDRWYQRLNHFVLFSYSFPPYTSTVSLEALTIAGVPAPTNVAPARRHSSLHSQYLGPHGGRSYEMESRHAPASCHINFGPNPFLRAREGCAKAICVIFLTGNYTLIHEIPPENVSPFATAGCETIAAEQGITSAQLLALSSDLTCAGLLAGSAYCDFFLTRRELFSLDTENLESHRYIYSLPGVSLPGWTVFYLAETGFNPVEAPRICNKPRTMKTSPEAMGIREGYNGRMGPGFYFESVGVVEKETQHRQSTGTAIPFNFPLQLWMRLLQQLLQYCQPDAVTRTRDRVSVAQEEKGRDTSERVRIQKPQGGARKERVGKSIH
ncbi:hypothetical protein DFH06DRAFT_1149938 [Mycena polygramma]|nr:hypothetical protein DFH06DRAFT_1149938 [Mycena polygramma]